MRAWCVTKLGEPAVALELRDELPLPEPPENMIRVRVAAAAVGLPDVFMCSGAYPLTPPLPFTPGQEMVGTVTAVGPGARHQIGNRVCGIAGFFLGFGAFAEEALALDDFVFDLAGSSRKSAPSDGYTGDQAEDGMEDIEAAAFTIGFHTAYVGLVRRARLVAGETVLVLGASGGAGSAAVQLAKALGARVIATTGDASKVDYCRDLGADEVIDVSRQDLYDLVVEFTDGQGADVVWDGVGGARFSAATRAVAHEGRILLVGFASGRWGIPDPAHMVENNYSVFRVVPTRYDRPFREQAQGKLLELWRNGSIRALVDRVYPFADLPRALARLADRKVRGRVVVRMN